MRGMTGFYGGKTWWSFWRAPKGTLFLCGTKASAEQMQRMVDKHRPDDNLRVQFHEGAP